MTYHLVFGLTTSMLSFKYVLPRYLILIWRLSLPAFGGDAPYGRFHTTAAMNEAFHDLRIRSKKYSRHWSERHRVGSCCPACGNSVWNVVSDSAPYISSQNEQKETRVSNENHFCKHDFWPTHKHFPKVSVCAENRLSWTT